MKLVNIKNILFNNNYNKYNWKLQNKMKKISLCKISTKHFMYYKIKNKSKINKNEKNNNNKYKQINIKFKFL